MKKKGKKEKRKKTHRILDLFFFINSTYIFLDYHM